MKSLLSGSFVLFLFLTYSSCCLAKMEVFVSIPPQKWLVDQIGKQLVGSRVLVKKGQEPHAFEPTPRQIASLSRAGLYFYMGMEFDRKIVGKITSSQAAVQCVDVSEGTRRLTMTGEFVGTSGDSDVRHLDPHIWLDPANLKIMAAVIAKSMVNADPGNKKVYEQNLQQLLQSINHLDNEIKKMLGPYKDGSFLVFHPAFGYFAHAFGLQQKAVEVHGKSPGPRQLFQILDIAKKEKIRVVFVQPQFDVKSAEVIARAIGGQVVPLDPLAEDVAGNLKKMAVAIQHAFAARQHVE